MADFTDTVYKGRTWKISVQWTLDGSPVNLTNYIVQSDIKLSTAHPSQPALLTLASGSGITITNAASGQFTMSISKTQSAALPIGDLYFDVAALSPAGEASTVLKGTLDVQDTVTKI